MGSSPERARSIVRGQAVSEGKLRRSRELRREMTPEERVLWECVRGQRLGFKFRRQQVIRGYIADFYCHDAGLVIELDGPVHDAQAVADSSRTALFEQLGIEVIRFRNEQVMGRLAEALERIVQRCRERVGLGDEPHPPAPSPGGRGGERPSESDSDIPARETATPPSACSPSPPGGGGRGVGSSP